MKLKPFGLFTATFTAAGLLTTALAVAGDISVAANKTSKIDLVYFATKYDCLTSGKPETFIEQKPSHGSISFQWVATKFLKDAAGCAGKPIKGTAVVYTPNKGFHGKDYAKVSFRFPTYIGSTDTRTDTSDYDITVK